MINNIFSKEKLISQENLPILIDNRERNSLVPAELYAKNLNLIFKQLPVGDYIINETIIERKEIKDFTQSIKSQRLFKQLTEIKQYPNYLLIIEGDIYTQKILHPNSLRGAIISIAKSYKIPIIFTRHAKETAQYIEILTKKKGKNLILTPTKKQFSKKEWQLNILQSFPNIGQKTAIKLLKKFHTLKEIFNKTEKELETILGKKTNSFFKIINKEFL